MYCSPTQEAELLKAASDLGLCLASSYHLCSSNTPKAALRTGPGQPLAGDNGTFMSNHVDRSPRACGLRTCGFLHYNLAELSLPSPVLRRLELTLKYNHSVFSGRKRQGPKRRPVFAHTRQPEVRTVQIRKYRLDVWAHLPTCTCRDSHRVLDHFSEQTDFEPPLCTSCIIWMEFLQRVGIVSI